MAQTAYLIRNTAPAVDVELPLHRAPTVDVDLTQAVAPADGDPGFRPTLSQVAANPSPVRARWLGDCGTGYRSASGRNWMRDRRAGFGERTISGT